MIAVAYIRVAATRQVYSMARKPKVGDPNKSVGYLRVSTEDQHLGPEAQRMAIEAWANRQGVTVVEWFEDHGISGAAPLEKRQALMAAISSLSDHGAGIMVIAKRDRLARDVASVAMIEALVKRKGARIVSAAGEGTDDDDPSSILMRRLIDSFAEYERAIIRARTKSALAAKKKKGYLIGSVPYGKRVSENGMLEDDENEKQVIQKILMLKDDGLSERNICVYLKHHEIRFRGKFLGQSQVHTILTRYRNHREGEQEPSGSQSGVTEE